MGSIRRGSTLLQQAFPVLFIAAAMISLVRPSMHPEFYPGSTRVHGGMAYRSPHGYIHQGHNGPSFYQQGSRSKREVGQDMNALIPGLVNLTRYEEEHACLCRPFYNCCNESALAGFCAGVIDLRTNSDFNQKHCVVEYHQCCDIATLCGDDLPCLTRLTIFPQPPSPHPNEPVFPSPPPPSPPPPSPGGPDDHRPPPPPPPPLPFPLPDDHLPLPPPPPFPVPSGPDHPPPPPFPVPSGPDHPPPPPFPRPDDQNGPPPPPPFPQPGGAGQFSPIPIPPPPPGPNRTPMPPPPTCGVRNFDGVGVRLAGSAEIKRTQYGEFPWMAAILRVDTVGRPIPADIYVCGGVLVSPSIVLSTAHNVEDYAKGHFFNLKVRLGEWDAMSDQEPFMQEDYKPKHLVLHPEYKPRVVLNDISVIVLERPVVFHSHIAPICLPEVADLDAYQNNVQHGCVVTGWGKDSFFGQYSNILKMIEISTVTKEVCEEKIRNTRLGTAFRLHNSFLCAGGDGLDACKGDGGSPLVCPSVRSSTSDVKDLRYVLVGLVSWGIGCAEVPPGVYVNVPRFVPWITEFIKEHDPGYDYSSLH